MKLLNDYGQSAPLYDYEKEKLNALLKEGRYILCQFELLSFSYKVVDESGMLNFDLRIPLKGESVNDDAVPSKRWGTISYYYFSVSVSDDPEFSGTHKWTTRDQQLLRVFLTSPGDFWFNECPLEFVNELLFLIRCHFECDKVPLILLSESAGKGTESIISSFYSDLEYLKFPRYKHTGEYSDSIYPVLQSCVDDAYSYSEHQRSNSLREDLNRCESPTDRENVASGTILVPPPFYSICNDLSLYYFLYCFCANNSLCSNIYHKDVPFCNSYSGEELYLTRTYINVLNFQIEFNYPEKTKVGSQEFGESIYLNVGERPDSLEFNISFKEIGDILNDFFEYPIDLLNYIFSIVFYKITDHLSGQIKDFRIDLMKLNDPYYIKDIFYKYVDLQPRNLMEKHYDA